MTFTDIRDVSDFLYKHSEIKDLDFKKQLGMSAAVLAFYVKGTPATTIESLLKQIAISYEKFTQTTDE